MVPHLPPAMKTCLLPSFSRDSLRSLLLATLAGMALPLSAWSSPPPTPSWVPGSGGTLPNPPVFTPVAGVHALLTVDRTHRRNKAFIFGSEHPTEPSIELAFDPPASIGASHYTLEYSPSSSFSPLATYSQSGSAVQLVGDNFQRRESESAWYRLRIHGGPYNGQVSNAVYVPYQTVETTFRGWSMDQSMIISGTMMPWVGYGKEGSVVVSKVPVEDSENLLPYVSMQWYRVNPATGDFTPIPGATQGRYITTAADVGYGLALRFTGDGTKVGGYLQVLTEGPMHSNPAYINNLTADTFRLNLQKNLPASLTPKTTDFRLSYYREGAGGAWEEVVVPLKSVTRLNAAVYVFQTVSPLPVPSTGSLLLENISDFWKITTVISMPDGSGGTFTEMMPGVYVPTPPPDTTAPSLTLLLPAAGSATPWATATFSGRVADVGGKPSVAYSTDGGTVWTPATVAGNANPYTWTAQVPLVPGGNDVQFRAQDPSDNTSPVLARRVVYNIPPPVISSPGANAGVPGPGVTLRGSLNVPGGKPGVQVSFDSGSTWLDAAVSGAGPLYAWTLTPSPNPLPGPLTALVRTIDVRGQAGAPVMRAFNLLVKSTAPLTITPDGSGTFTALLHGQRLNLGMPYTVTATPGAGQVFLEWRSNGVPVSSAPKLTFTMQEGLTLTPVFIPSPFASKTGTYNGLVGSGASALPDVLQELGVTPTGPMEFDAAAVGPLVLHRNGLITLTLAANGSFTGTLLYAGQSLPFRGQFSGSGRTVVSVPRAGKPGVSLDLRFDPDFNGGQVSGSLSMAMLPDDLVILAGRSIHTGLGINRHPLSGQRFNLILHSPDRRVGNGYAMLVVNPNGATVLTGKLGDGMAFTAGPRLFAQGTGWLLPWHTALYAGQRGLVNAILRLDPEPAAGTNMQVACPSGFSPLWLRPAVPGAAAFPQGFYGVVGDTSGVRYLPQAGTSMATGTPTAGNFNLLFDATVTGSTGVIPGLWPSSNLPALTKPVPAGLTFSLTPATGVFRGSFPRNVAGRTVSTAFEGVVWPAPDFQGAGFFTTPDGAGRMRLLPVATP